MAKKKPRQPKLTLQPLTYPEAVKALLEVKPKPKQKKKG